MVLALGLQSAGHEVLVLSSANFKGWAEGLGVPFVAFAPDLEDHSRKREAWNELVRAKVRLILRAFDEDRDGHISLREASALTTALGRDAFPEDVWQDLCRRGRCSPAAGPDARGLWLLLKDEPGELEAQYGAARRALRLRDQEEELPLGKLTSDTVDPFCLSAMDVRAFADALQRFGPEVLVGTGPGWELVAPLAEHKFGIPYLTMRYQPVMGWPFGNEDLFQPVMRTWYAHLCSLEDTLVKPEHEITPLSDMTFAGFYDRYQGGGLFIPFLAALSDRERLSGAVLSSSTLPVRHELEAQVTRNKFTGFLFMEEEGDGKGWSSSEPAAELQAFLSRGPTACIGWGSMVSERGPHHMVRLAVAALKEAKMQGVILGGWAGLGAEALRQAGGSSDTEGLCSYAEQRVRFIEAAPHGWLFPRCSCVVHHGGLGTIAASLRAGVPMVITPIAVEQPANAALMSSLGWCIALEQLDEVTPSELAGALKSASTDEGLFGRAKSAQALVLEEDGTKEAVCSVNRFIENARERRGVGGAGVSRRAWPLRSAAAVAAASFAFAVARVHKYFRGHRDL